MVVRGAASSPGVAIGRPVVTLDGGCGRAGGPLVAACFAPAGEIVQIVEA